MRELLQRSLRPGPWLLNNTRGWKFALSRRENQDPRGGNGMARARTLSLPPSAISDTHIARLRCLAGWMALLQLASGYMPGRTRVLQPGCRHLAFSTRAPSPQCGLFCLALFVASHTGTFLWRDSPTGVLGIRDRRYQKH